jgi:EAL domain-containing protein (putative c-di-GMP-specific phosphodiesterase class I)
MTTSPVQDKRFRQMLDAASDAMVVVDQGGGVVALNREAERLFGWTDAELRGEPSSRLIPQRFHLVYDALGVSDAAPPTQPARPPRTPEATAFISRGRRRPPGSRSKWRPAGSCASPEPVDEGQFQLYAQAIVPLAPDVPARSRCEILLRLPDERGGVESADAFLPQAERHRLTPAIDRWVVRQTVAILSQWHREHPDFELPVCSINLSVSSLDDADLIPAVRECLAQHRLPANALCFEITEAAALGNFAQLVRLIAEIRATGCGVGLDDFGNSLGSFAHLKALSVDYVKIGGHYVRGVADDPVYGTLVGAVNEIGRIMGIVTIAEEAESETILKKLRGLGVGYAQGHAVAPPAPRVDRDGAVALPHVPRSPGSQ